MSILYKNGDGNIVSLIPDMNNIDDTTVSASTTYSSSKIEQINAEYPIADTTTGINPSISDSADGLIQDLTVYGRTDTVEGELHGIGEDGELEITACGKNLFDKGAEHTDGATLSITNGEIEFNIYFTTYTNYIPCDGNTTYVLSAGDNNSTIWAYRQDKTPISGTSNYTEGTTTPLVFTTPAEAAYLRVSLLIDQANSAQLELGSTATAYESYVSTSATVTSGIPLYSVGDIKDELDEKKGVVIKRCEKTTEQGEEVIVPLATPVEIPLTASELSQLRNLRTYNPITNVTITDDPYVDVGYLLDTDNGQAVADVQNGLQKQIDNIKNAIKPRVYAFYIDQNDSNPATCVHPYYNTKYGCDNLFYQNAYMDYEKDEFNYGSWKEFIYEFFKPCMLAYDGHVDYYLDPDDYSKKFDGGDSDISDMTYNGNVMVQIKKLYFKRWTTDGKYYCIISDKKLDKSFKAYAHHDIKGNVLDYIYRAAYDGSYDGTRLRSISGIDYHNVDALTANKIMSNTTRQQEIDFAKANNDANERGEGWNILHKAEWDMMRDLLLLIGMNTNTQATFGNGNIATYVSTSNTGILPTGTMDKKGLFYGKNDNVSGVKVFGFEMPWGNIWKSCLGWNLINGVHYTKMTHGTEDGSAGTGFNISGTGYLPLDAVAPSGTSGGYVNTYTVGDNGYIPLTASGSATTYTCDGLWFNNGVNALALVGGASDNGARCGAFYANLHTSAAFAYWDIGAVLSYKPLARGVNCVQAQRSTQEGVSPQIIV